MEDLDSNFEPDINVDAATRLGRISLLQEEINLRKQQLQVEVDEARRSGLPWSQIGRALSITRQAAMRRFDSEARFRHSDSRRQTSVEGPLT